MIAIIGFILIVIGVVFFVASLLGVKLLQRGDEHTMDYALFWASLTVAIAGTTLMFFNNGFTSIP